jgi:hypothetical protein
MKRGIKIKEKNIAGQMNVIGKPGLPSALPAQAGKAYYRLNKVFFGRER